MITATVVDTTQNKMIGKRFRDLAEAINWCSEMCALYPKSHAKISRNGKVIWRLKIS